MPTFCGKNELCSKQHNGIISLRNSLGTHLRNLVMKFNKKLLKAQNKERNLELLNKLGYEATQMKCPYQYKDRNLLFYPTTGTYFDEYTRLTGKIATLPSKSSLIVEKRFVVGKYGREYERDVYLFSEFALPKDQLPTEEQMNVFAVSFQ